MKRRIAIPTKNHEELEDLVSEVFGKAKTFTIVDVEDGKVKNVQVMDNPASSYDHGSGPVAVKTLADKGVDWVLAGQLGPGASNILEHHNIGHITVEFKTKVSDVLQEFLSKLKERQDE